MKASLLLMTTMLTSSTLLMGAGISHAADTITNSTANTGTSPATSAEMQDPRVAATSFVEHINYARVALAMKNPNLAKQHISQARNMLMVVRNATAEDRVVTGIESGRISYAYDTKYKLHYFPVQTGLVQMKTVDNGASWATSDLAVTDADMVYLTLDLNGDEVEEHLDEADAALMANNFKLTDEHLAELTDEVVTVDKQESLPNIKAHDNIALARQFIAGKNYSGASYALTNADDALDEMQKDDNNKARVANITAMRKDVSNLQDHIAKKDPNMIQKAATNIDGWWQDLREWSDASM